jgi:hypothetical protein
MKGWGRNSRNWLCLATLVLIGFLLSSCSLFESKITIPVAKKIDIPAPPEPPVCDLPYCSIDLGFPLEAITNPRIYVSKSERRLWLVQGSILVRDYHIGLGPSPKGDKYLRGDGRTPEGEYFVCMKNSSSQYYKSLGINYPSPKHAENGLASGVISFGDYCSIVSANDSKKLPPPNTALGGAIFIHGGGCHMDWTLGCVAVDNRAIDELFQVVSIGTPVNILP